MISLSNRLKSLGNVPASRSDVIFSAIIGCSATVTTIIVSKCLDQITVQTATPAVFVTATNNAIRHLMYDNRTKWYGDSNSLKDYNYIQMHQSCFIEVR